MRGVSTLEILIAFAMLTLTLTAVVMVVFSNQSISIDTQISDEALSKAGLQLEATRAAAREDFSSLALGIQVQSEASGPLTYTKTLTVAPDPADPSNADKKLVTSLISWVSGGRNLFVTLSTLLTSPTAGNSCSLSVSNPDRWKNPQILNPLHKIDINPDTLTDIFVAGKYAYITGVHTGVKEDLFIVDVSDPTYPVIVGSVETGTGLKAVTVSGNYAYVANQGVTAQLQVIDISDPAHPALIPGASRKVTGAGGEGNSIYYNDKTIYLGLTKSGAGPQFMVYDVSSPTNPVAKGTGYSTNHDVNGIRVSGDYAYITHPEASTDPIREQVTAVNINQLSGTFLQRVGGFYYNGA
ncbi:MAG: hypothetical protein V4436_02790, partial [Patescibacteria group bacterium]